MANPVARIRSRSPGSKEHLRVQQTSKGVFVDRELHNGSRQFVGSYKPKSMRALAKWILENVKEEA